MLQTGTNLDSPTTTNPQTIYQHIFQKIRLMSYWWTHQPLLHAETRPPISPIPSQITTLEDLKESSVTTLFLPYLTLQFIYEMTRRFSLLYGTTFCNTSGLRRRSFMITNLIMTGYVLQQRYQAL